MRFPKRLFHLSCTALLLITFLTPAAAARRFSMSYVYFGSPSSYVERVDGTQGSLDEISPNYFNLNSDGTLNFTGGNDAAAFVEQMHRRGVRVVPFLSNHWDRELGRKALSNRKQLAEQIARAVVRYGLDGVNVDIENVTHQDRNAYSEFVELLRQKLPEDKIVAVSVAANPYGYTQGWHGSYDYRRLGAAAPPARWPAGPFRSGPSSTPSNTSRRTSWCWASPSSGASGATAAPSCRATGSARARSRP